MNNKVFGTTFAAIMGSALLFFGVANAGAAVVDKWIFPTEKFGDHTYIGTTNVSNMDVASAMAQFSGTAESFRASSELLVTYQDATAKYPLNNANILLEETAARAQTGVQNTFVFDLQEQTTKKFLVANFQAAEFSNIEAERITMKLEQALESGLAQTHVTISDDSLAVDRETVSEVVFPQGSTGEGAAAVISAIDEIQIAPGAKFSFLEFLGQLPPTGATDKELTKIASAIYAAVLETNFTVDERSIGTSIPKNIPAGQEAAINRSLGVDLVFTNPNASSFTLNTELTGDSLIASLSGFPFIYDYALQTSGKETVEPRLIKQYSAFVTAGKAVDEEGSEGMRIHVNRSVISDGNELELESISTDFYPPVNRVEIYPLETEPVSVESVPGTNGSETPDGETEEGLTEGGQVPADSSGEGAGDQPAGDGSSTGNSENKQDPKGNEKNIENPGTDGDAKSSEPVYDKGGNLVNP